MIAQHIQAALEATESGGWVQLPLFRVGAKRGAAAHDFLGDVSQPTEGIFGSLVALKVC